jgi:hypothetical protein
MFFGVLNSLFDALRTDTYFLERKEMVVQERSSSSGSAHTSSGDFIISEDDLHWQSSANGTQQVPPPVPDGKGEQ